MCHQAHNVSGDLQEQLDRQTSMTETERHKQEAFRIKRMGDVKGGGTEKTDKRENDRKRLQFQPPPVSVCLGTSLCASRKGQLRREHPVHGPLE